MVWGGSGARLPSLGYSPVASPLSRRAPLRISGRRSYDGHPTLPPGPDPCFGKAPVPWKLFPPTEAACLGKLGRAFVGRGGYPLRTYEHSAGRRAPGRQTGIPPSRRSAVRRGYPTLPRQTRHASTTSHPKPPPAKLAPLERPATTVRSDRQLRGGPRPGQPRPAALLGRARHQRDAEVDPGLLRRRSRLPHRQPRPARRGLRGDRGQGAQLGARRVPRRRRPRALRRRVPRRRRSRPTPSTAMATRSSPRSAGR